MRIYVRHATKEYKNSRSQDPNITFRGRRESRIAGRNLIELWGVPSLIITSPYLRCRETAREMIGGLDVDIIVDPNVSEYMGHQRGKKIVLTSETEFYNPPMDQSIDDLISRCSDHNNEFSYLDSSPEVVWILTHSFFIHHLRSILRLPTTTRTKELSGFTSRITTEGELKTMLIKN